MGKINFEFPQIEDSGCLLPDLARAQAYRYANDHLTLKKLIKAIGIAEKSFALDFALLIQSLDQATEGLKQSGKLSSFIHSLCNTILMQIRDQQTGPALESISQLSAQPLIVQDTRIGLLHPENWNLAEQQCITQILNEEDKEVWHAASASDTEPPWAAQLIHLTRDAMTTIVEANTELAREIDCYIGEIGMLDAPTFISGSAKTLPGFLLLNRLRHGQNSSTIIELLIHETTHQYIFMVEERDQLFLNDRELSFYSELRDSERPLIGIFHAMVVMARIIWCIGNLAEKGCFSTSHGPFVAAFKTPKELSYLDVFDSLLATVQQHAELTPMGLRIVDSAEQLVAAAACKSLWKES
ncbi:MAG: HEXXH motif-containing putative peptide modification protein [Pseudomonadota bacterium]